MGRTLETEVGTLSRFSDLADAGWRSNGRPTRVLPGWFGSCSARISVLRTLTLFMLSALVGNACLLASLDARADGPVPPATDFPPVLSMTEALQIFRARGLDLLIAEAAVKSAEGDVGVAGAVPNPVVNGGYGRVFNYNPVCAQCSSNYWAVGLSDSAAIEDSLSGKRGLRLKVARNALQAARLSRDDALRTIEFQVKSAYAQIAQASAACRSTKENQATEHEDAPALPGSGYRAARSTRAISRASRRRSSSPIRPSTRRT